MTRRLIVWRHGETAHNAGGIYQGQLDTELSQVGAQQARVAALVLAARGPDRIVASDLRRAADTARVLAEITGHPVVLDPRLREIDVGAWSGRTHQQVQQDYPAQSAALARGEDVVRGEHGESVADVATRTAALAAELTEGMARDELIVLATHGLAGRTLVAGLVGWSQQQALRSLGGLANAHWAELAEHSTGWRLVSWNHGVSPAGDPRPTLDRTARSRS